MAESPMLNQLIIYIEDSANDVQLLQHALRQTRHQGRFVHLPTVPDARVYFERSANLPELPALILVDLHIGVESGKGLVEYIRSFESFRKVPIVTLSGSYLYEDLDKAYETGANLFLIKPQNLKGWTEMVFRIRDYFPASG